MWISPAGQTIHIDRNTDPPPLIDPRAQPPDAGQLHEVDAEMTREAGLDHDPPMLLPDWDDPPPF